MWRGGWSSLQLFEHECFCRKGVSLLKMEPLSSQGATWQRQGAMGAMGAVALGKVSPWCREEFFCSKNNQSLQQSPQRCGTVPMTEGFQDAFGHGSRWSLPFLQRLDLVISGGPFQTELFPWFFVWKVLGKGNQIWGSDCEYDSSVGLPSKWKVLPLVWISFCCEQIF